MVGTFTNVGAAMIAADAVQYGAEAVKKPTQPEL